MSKFNVGDKIREYYLDGRIRAEGIVTKVRHDGAVEYTITKGGTVLTEHSIGEMNRSSPCNLKKLVKKKKAPAAQPEPAKPTNLPNVYTCEDAAWIRVQGAVYPTGDLRGPNGKTYWDHLQGKHTRVTIEVLE